jgi:hypothetical protein
MRSRMIALTILTVAAATGAQAQTISRTLDPNFPLSGFGKGAVGTVGQTFTAPSSASALTNFQFYLSNDLDNGGNGAGLSFQEYVMAWDATNLTPTGPVLFQSGIIQGNGGDAFAPFMFNPGNVAVSPNNVYVAFITTAGVTSGNTAAAFNALGGSDDTSDGGSLVFSVEDTNFNNLMTSQWSVVDGTNAAFSAQFTSNTSSVPEPSELILIATGLTTLAGSVRFRRRKVAS